MTLYECVPVGGGGGGWGRLTKAKMVDPPSPQIRRLGFDGHSIGHQYTDADFGVVLVIGCRLWTEKLLLFDSIFWATLRNIISQCRRHCSLVRQLAKRHNGRSSDVFLIQYNYSYINNIECY